jgi:hypothetical protein
VPAIIGGKMGDVEHKLTITVLYTLEPGTVPAGEIEALSLASGKVEWDTKVSPSRATRSSSRRAPAASAGAGLGRPQLVAYTVH